MVFLLYFLWLWYDVCLNCSNKFYSKDELVNNHGIKIDEHNHQLVYMITNKNWNCNLCLEKNESIEPTYYCTKCDFNVCMNCMEKISDEEKFPFFTDGERLDNEVNSVKVKCHKHPLIYCITSRTRKSFSWDCNLCMRSYGAECWSFFCSVCDYDICFECYINLIEFK